MRSLGWHLLQYDCCPYKKKKIGHRFTQRKDHVTPCREKTAIYKASKESSTETNPAITLILDFWLPEVWENKFLHSAIVMAALATQYTFSWLSVVSRIKSIKSNGCWGPRWPGSCFLFPHLILRHSLPRSSRQPHWLFSSSLYTRHNSLSYKQILYCSYSHVLVLLERRSHVVSPLIF